MTVQYNTEKVSKKKVFYSGTDILKTGYALCYDRDYGTAADSDVQRALRVEKPATANLDYFAGVVGEWDNGKTGPCQITIIQAEGPPGVVVPLWTDQSCTILETKLAVADDSYAFTASAGGAKYCARALQTVNRSGTAGLVLGQLMRVPVAEIDPANKVTLTIADLTGTLTGTANGALADVVVGDLDETAVATINKNFKEVQAAIGKAKDDLEAIIASLQSAGLMAN